MKKTISIILAIAMIGAPVWAATEPKKYEDDGNSFGESDVAGGQSIVRYSVSASYSVTIPADIAFTALGQTYDAGIVANNVVLEEGDYMVVTMSSQNGGLKNGSEVIKYSVESEYEIGSYEIRQAEWLNVMTVTPTSAASGNGTVTKHIWLTTDKDAEVTGAGEYVDNLTFQVEVNEGSMSLAGSTWTLNSKIAPFEEMLLVYDDRSGEYVSGGYDFDGTLAGDAVSNISQSIGSLGENISMNQVSFAKTGTPSDESIDYSYFIDLTYNGESRQGWSYATIGEENAYFNSFYSNPPLSPEESEAVTDAYVGTLFDRIPVTNSLRLVIHDPGDNEAWLLDWLRENATR